MEPSGNSAMTVLVTVVIMALIGLGIYYGFIAGKNDTQDGGGVKIELGGGEKAN